MKAVQQRWTLPWPCRPGHRGASLGLRKSHYVVISSILKETGKCKLGRSKIDKTTPQHKSDRPFTNHNTIEQNLKKSSAVCQCQRSRCIECLRRWRFWTSSKAFIKDKFSSSFSEFMTPQKQQETVCVYFLFLNTNLVYVNNNWVQLSLEANNCSYVC